MTTTKNVYFTPCTKIDGLKNNSVMTNKLQHLT